MDMPTEKPEPLPGEYEAWLEQNAPSSCGDRAIVSDCYSTNYGHGYAAACVARHPHRIGPWATIERGAIAKWNGMQLDAQNGKDERSDEV